jgi:hypothetical protein
MVEHLAMHMGPLVRQHHQLIIAVLLDLSRFALLMDLPVSGVLYC